MTSDEALAKAEELLFRAEQNVGGNAKDAMALAAIGSGYAQLGDALRYAEWDREADAAVKEKEGDGS